MKIAINGIYLNFYKKNDGIGRYTLSLLKEFRKYNNVKFYVFVDRFFKYKEIKKKFGGNIIPVFIPVPTFRLFLLRFWNFVLLPLFLKVFNIDLYFAPDGISALKGAKKFVVTIHDLAFMHYPENVLPKFLKFYTSGYNKSILFSDAIITVSNYSKKDIVKNYKIENDKITVIYNGIEKSFSYKNENNLITEWKNFNLKSDYIFYFGTIEPRKNLTGLLDAFETVRNSVDLKFVITGKEGWLYSEVKEKINNSKYKKDILLTGFLNDEELKVFLQNANVFVYVPILEGFGLPVVEAMSLGKWIVTSNTSSIPELIDDETIAVNPNNIKEISDAIIFQLNKNKVEPFNKSAVEKSQKFSWEISAKKHIELFEKIAGKNFA